jgi:hypothetical protein
MEEKTHDELKGAAKKKTSPKGSSMEPEKSEEIRTI